MSIIEGSSGETDSQMTEILSGSGSEKDKVAELDETILSGKENLEKILDRAAHAVYQRIKEFKRMA